AAHLPATQLAELAQQGGLAVETLKAELERIQQQGWASDGNEVEASAQALAAPVFNDQGEAVAALSLPASAWRASPELGEALKQAAVRISAALGWQAGRR